MPGPVSDSYDPEFGTAANAHEVREALEAVVKQIDAYLGSREYILDVVRREKSPLSRLPLSERDLRLLRFAADRAMETL